MSQDTEKSDVPEVPAHIAARKGTALTSETAALLNEKAVMDESGHIHKVGQARAAREKSPAAIEAEARARKYAGPYPLSGLTPDQINAIRNKGYEGAPAMEIMLGDRTQAFVNWLWANKPWDAAKRFGGTREIWPTTLPKQWPPARPADDVDPAPLPQPGGPPPPPYSAPNGALFTAEQVQSMIEAAVDKALAKAATKPTPRRRTVAPATTPA